MSTSPTTQSIQNPPVTTGNVPVRTFPKSRRVRDRKEYTRIQGRGLRLATPHFLVMALRQQGPRRPARFGITASKKSGESVQRSRIKRVLREAFRLHQAEFPEGWDFVVIAREGGDKLSLSDVMASLRVALHKLKNQDARPPQQRQNRPNPRPQGPRK